MPKILLISAVFPPEPVVSSKLSYDIASELARKNSVTVISPKPSRPFGFQFTSETLHFNFKHIQTNSFICASSSIYGRIKESHSFGKHCYKYIAENFKNIDIIYANTFPILAQFCAVYAARKYKIPIIIHVQDIFPEAFSKKLPAFSAIFNGLFIPLDKYILSKASIVIAISKNMKGYLEKSRKLDNGKITVVPNWQDEESFLNYTNQPFDAEGELFTFMYLGNIGPVAGVDLLLKSFAKANNRNSRLVIAGSGTMKASLVKQAENYHECIIEFWPVPEGRVPEIQSMADVLILPVKKGAASASIPSKLPAYMFSGKPIIACVDKDSDTAAALNEANCGWVIHPENTEELSALMVKIIALPSEKMRSLGLNGRNYALDFYSKKNNLPKLITIITESLATFNKTI